MIEDVEWMVIWSKKMHICISNECWFFFFKANLVINFYHALIISEKMVKTIDSITEVYKKKVMNERSSNDI